MSAWNKGLTKSDPRVALYAKKLSGRTVSSETRKKISASRFKGIPFYDKCLECGAKKGHSKRARCCNCAAKWRVAHYPNSMLGRQLTPEHKAALLRSQNRQTQPTKPETLVRNTLNLIFGPYNPYQYSGCGDNRFWITTPNGTRNPDFVAPKLKLVIEVFGRYWHPPDHEAKAVADYAAAGWKCLVVWEKPAFSLRDDLLYFTYPDEERNELWDFTQTPL